MRPFFKTAMKMNQWTQAPSAAQMRQLWRFILVYCLCVDGVITVQSPYIILDAASKFEMLRQTIQASFNSTLASFTGIDW